MRLLVRITLGYFLFGAIVVTLFRDNPTVLLGDIARKLPGSLHLFVSTAWWAIPAVGAMVLFVPRQELTRRLMQALIAVFACTTLFLTFTMLKATMPFITPFWADPLFANVDRVLHFGQDPWEIAHRLSPWVNPDRAGQIYFTNWVAPAMFLPVLMVLFDSDASRVRRFIWLYAFAWIGLGNVLALGFLSAGPVFYDRLYDGGTFAGLQMALADSGVSTGYMGMLQDRLWDSYQTGVQEAGSGISAFPSVHLGMVTVIALYLAERWRWLIPGSVALVALYEFFSVYLGWHYAVDGYASILLVGGVWAVMRRRARQSWTAPADFAVAAQ